MNTHKIKNPDINIEYIGLKWVISPPQHELSVSHNALQIPSGSLKS